MIEILALSNTTNNYNINKRTAHGRYKNRIYPIWNTMIQRCSNPKHNRYKYYQQKNITVCERWKDINNFIEDMYSSYQEGLQIDRINNDGNYEPSNCRWATKEVQARNKRMIMSTNTSGYRGVSWNKRGNKWEVRINFLGKKHMIGLFDDIIKAAIAYDNFVIDNNLEHTINGILLQEENSALQR